MSLFEHTHKTVRGQKFWTREHTSQRGLPYLTYQAVGPGNQDGPKDWDHVRAADGQAWHLTAKAAAAALALRLEVAARREALQAELTASEARLAAYDAASRAGDRAFDAQQARELDGICDDCQDLCKGTCLYRRQSALATRLRYPS